MFKFLVKSLCEKENFNSAIPGWGKLTCRAIYMLQEYGVGWWFRHQMSLTCKEQGVGLGGEGAMYEGVMALPNKMLLTLKVDCLLTSHEFFLLNKYLMNIFK